MPCLWWCVPYGPSRTGEGAVMRSFFAQHEPTLPDFSKQLAPRKRPAVDEAADMLLSLGSPDRVTQALEDALSLNRWTGVQTRTLAQRLDRLADEKER